MPKPTPCSPVHVPPSASACSTMRAFTALARATSSASSRSTRKIRWKLPSPTWPTRGASRPASAMSSLTAVMHRRGARSARRRRSRCPWRRGAAPWSPRTRRGAPATAGCAPPPGGPLELGAAEIARDRAPSPPARRRGPRSHGTRRTASARPVALELGIADAGVHGQLVEQLDARHRHARLDRDDHGIDRILDGRDGHTADEIASGMPCRRSRISVITPSVPSEPTSRRVRS